VDSNSCCILVSIKDREFLGEIYDCQLSRSLLHGVTNLVNLSAFVRPSSLLEQKYLTITSI
jgi:hypothetical protein